MNTLAAFWTPWSWSGDGDGPPSQQLEHRARQKQDRGEGEQHIPSSPCSRPQSAPATTMRVPASSLPDQEPQPKVGGDHGDGTTSRLSQRTGTNTRSTGDLPCRRIGDLAAAPGGAPNLFAAARRRGCERGGHGDQAPAASPDFQELGPSDFGSTPLTGCDLDALPTGFLHGPRPVAAIDKSGGGRQFRRETLMARRGSSSGSEGKKHVCLGQQTKAKKRPATFRPTTAPATDRGRRVSPEDKNGVDRPNAPPGERTPLLGRRSGDVGDSDTDDNGSGSVPTWKGVYRAPPSLSTRSPSSLGSTSTSLAALLEVWTKREFAAAKRAVSCRPQRSRLCLALRAHESTSAGMAAAQRAHRGAFVMSKMGNAKARSTWRP